MPDTWSAMLIARWSHVQQHSCPLVTPWEAYTDSPQEEGLDTNRLSRPPGYEQRAYFRHRVGEARGGNHHFASISTRPGYNHGKVIEESVEPPFQENSYSR